MMKVLVVLLIFPLLKAYGQETFRKPPNCMGREEAMPMIKKCSSTGKHCGGGTLINGKMSCKNGYSRAGRTGKICIPKCTGPTQTCLLAGGNCTAVNFCSCGPGRSFDNGRCLLSIDDKCGGKCHLGTCQSDGSCLCPQDYKLNTDKTNCEPVADCPYHSVAFLPNLCQCKGSSYYHEGICKNAPTIGPTTATTTEETTTARVTSTTTSTMPTTSTEITTPTSTKPTTTTSTEITTASTETSTKPTTTTSTEATTTTSVKPTTEATTTTSTRPTTISSTEATTTTLDISDSTSLSYNSTNFFEQNYSTPFGGSTSSGETTPMCTCKDIQQLIWQILNELTKLENGY